MLWCCRVVVLALVPDDAERKRLINPFIKAYSNNNI